MPGSKSKSKSENKRDDQDFKYRFHYLELYHGVISIKIKGSLKMKLKKLIIILILIFWPLSLFFHNTPQDWIRYVIPSIFLLASYLLFEKKSKYYFVPLIFISFFEPKLAPLPFLFILIDQIFQRRNISKIIANKYLLVVCLLSLASLLINWKPFWGQTIFKTDYEAQQLVIRNTQLYPSVLLARTFQNKPKIYFDKLTSNFFALTDPNNYFFSFHPREIVGNQNIVKFPFVGFILLLVGVYTIGKSKNKKFVLSALFASLISLSILSSFDRQDFILWLSISLLIIDGLNSFETKNKKLVPAVCYLFVLFSIPEFIRLFIK
jgi:hypothetical protein